VVGNQARKRTSIGVSRQTKANLDSIKHAGQSYSGLIQELLEFWKAKKGEYQTRGREKGRIEEHRPKIYGLGGKASEPREVS